MDLNYDRALFSNNPKNLHSKPNSFRNTLYEKTKSKSNKKGNKFYGNKRQILYGIPEALRLKDFQVI